MVCCLESRVNKDIVHCYINCESKQSKLESDFHFLQNTDLLVAKNINEEHVCANLCTNPVQIVITYLHFYTKFSSGKCIALYKHD